MQRPLQITFHGTECSEAIEQEIRDRVAELERFYDRITGCHVIVEVPHRRHEHGNLYEVHVDIHVPGKDLVVSKERRHDHAHEDVRVAIRDAFAAAVRQLEDYVRQQRGKVKRHELPDHGTVTKVFRESGYGFVELPHGMEVYFHRNSVAGQAFDDLHIGDGVRITYVEGESDKGPQATTVVPMGKHHLVGDDELDLA